MLDGGATPARCRCLSDPGLACRNVLSAAGVEGWLADARHEEYQSDGGPEICRSRASTRATGQRLIWVPWLEAWSISSCHRETGFSLTAHRSAN